VAWLCGVWPAVLALAASTLCAAHYVITPDSNWAIDAPADLFGLIVFFIVGTISIALFARIETQRQIALQQSALNQKLNEELTHREKQKDEFIALLAHELRNPLAPIGNSISLLEKQSDLPDSSLQVVQVLRNNFNHLVRLTNDLLDVSRFLNDKIELKRERVDMVECVRLAIDMNRFDLSRKKHALYTDLPDQPVWAFLDQVRCCQIIVNLLSNAIRYTPDEGKITIRLSADEHNVMVEVRDNGLGIPDAIRGKIFTPFFQAQPKQSRYASGLGLGLSIVKKLVQLHGGAISVNSNGLFNGTQILVSFPLGVDAAFEHDTLSPHGHADCDPKEPRKAADLAVGTRSESDLSLAHRVLVVDDHRDTADTLSALLAVEGFSVEVARTGQEAVEVAMAFFPQVVLLDIGLPELDGFEVARLLRAQFTKAQLRIIALSGWGSEADKAKGLQSGFDAHLTKPICLQELLQLIREPDLSAVAVAAN
ncbi:MAG: ATP-binding protein, partial [bacterium]|nr:ATP-binding protein [bacterium]